MNDQDILSRLTIKKMNVALNLSRETTAFTADIYYEGEKVGSAENDGNGGATNCWIKNLIVANYGYIIETWIDARAADAENAKRGLLASRKNEKWIQSRLEKGMFVFTTGDLLVAQGGLGNPIFVDFEAERNFAIEKVKSEYPDAKDFRFPESLV